MDLAATWLVPELLKVGLANPVPSGAEELAERVAAAGLKAAREAMIAALAEELGGDDQARERCNRATPSP